mmetsp:Transcript_12180/g.13886  ORF Transcript_12180/g.13886 Transcript_12180/m.13886 type:complete len:95 (+) Transcript_12180:591-875(+)
MLQVLLCGRIIESSSDESLGCVQRALWVRHGLSLSWESDELLAVISEGYNGRSSSLTLGILDNLRGATFHDCDAGVGRAQVDSDNGGKGSCLGN